MEQLRYRPDPNDRPWEGDDRTTWTASCLTCDYNESRHGDDGACPNIAATCHRQNDLVALALSFHVLEHPSTPTPHNEATARRVAGVSPFDPHRLAAFGRSGVGSGAGHAIRFVLSVYGGRSDLEAFKLGPFDAVAALQGWDDRNRAAFAAWASSPWWA